MVRNEKLWEKIRELNLKSEIYSNLADELVKLANKLEEENEN